MVTLRDTLVFGYGIGGLLSANFAFAQVECTLPFDENMQIGLETLSRTLSACSNNANLAVWSELVDRGTYELIYSSGEDRRITGIMHADWAREIPLSVGTLFGFRAVVFSPVSTNDETIEIVTYFPGGTRAPDVTTKPMTPGATEAALFLIGSEAFVIPGEWRIELRHNGRILAAQRFNLTAEAGQ